MSYLRGDNLSEDPRTDCSERLFISTIMRDTKEGKSGRDYQRGYARVLISTGAAWKLGSLSPNENTERSLFQLGAHGRLGFLLHGGWGLGGRGGVRLKTLKNAHFVPESAADMHPPSHAGPHALVATPP